MEETESKYSIKDMLKHDYECLTNLSIPAKLLITWQCPTIGVITFIPEIKSIGMKIYNSLKETPQKEEQKAAN